MNAFVSRPPGFGALHERYLRLLGFLEPPTDLAGLQALVRRHLCCVPFENVSKLRLIGREGRGRVTRLGEFLDGVEQQDLGGTCYTSNPFFADLLRAIGYDVALYAADMSAPNVHTSIRVRIHERDWHVDVGYAAPFYAPIPLDTLPHEIRWGHDRYVLSVADRAEGERDRYLMTVSTNGQWRHSYLVHPPPRHASFFDPIVLQSFERDRTFMRCLRITRYFEERAVELRNHRLLHITADGATERSIDSLSELRRAVDEDLEMPRCPVEEAVAVLERVNGREFFGPQPWRDSTD